VLADGEKNSGSSVPSERKNRADVRVTERLDGLQNSLPRRGRKCVLLAPLSTRKPTEGRRIASVAGRPPFNGRSPSTREFRGAHLDAALLPEFAAPIPSRDWAAKRTIDRTQKNQPQETGLISKLFIAAMDNLPT
jgi:hypothetical protein